jgi:3-oxoacyl-[acyl-carrier-protein] synthase-3
MVTFRLTYSQISTLRKWSTPPMSGFSTRTGIEERHLLKGEGLGTSDMAAEAVRGLLKKRGIDASEIDLLICATVTPDHVFPATANIISDKIGAVNAWSYDIGAACSGFIYALEHRCSIHRNRQIQEGSCCWW